jgi:hypothetical protein
LIDSQGGDGYRRNPMLRIRFVCVRPKFKKEGEFQMANSNLFRIAGYAAFLGPLLWIIALGAAVINPTITVILFGVASIVFLVVIYALYVIHRAEASGLALVAALLSAVGLIVSLFTGDPSVPANATLYGISTVVFGGGIILFGWLAYKSAKMPRGLAIAALIAGIISLIAGIAYLGGTGMADLANLLNTLSIIPFIVWMIWLGRLFLSGKQATA